MIRMAILDDYLPQQLASGAEAPIEDTEVVWTGDDLEALITHAREKRAQVVIVNVDVADRDDPGATIERVKRETKAELVIALYSFLRRADLDAIAAHGRAVKSPASVARLRSQMLGVLVRNLFNGEPPEPEALPGPRYSKAQLAKLMEIASTVQCECPNHVGELVAGLIAFEGYANGCENKNPEDAAIHRMLGQKTGRARLIMEEALAKLIEHENITI